MSKTFLTIYTDISFKKDINPHVMGYSIWSKCLGEGKTLTGVKELKEIEWTPNLAEAWTVCKGIDYMSKHFSSKYNAIVVKTDNKTAIHLLGISYKPWGADHFTFEHQNKMITFMKNKRKHLPIYVKHVKGHEGGKTTQSWVNEWCDKHSKNALNTYLYG